jgi:hypothetical protein
VLNKAGAGRTKIKVMNKQDLEKFIIEFPENENPECMDSCDEWFSDLFDAIEEEFDIEITEEIEEQIEEILDTL